MIRNNDKNIEKNKLPALELYIHIPFCARKCGYCDFLSFAVSKQKQEEYLHALLAEISGRSREYQDYRITSIFFGGGTPSLVEAKWIEALLHAIRQNYKIETEAEITIEVNPGTAAKEKLECYFRAGINRLSIGLQSTREEELKRLGRIHTYARFEETYKLARSIGFTNISVDLMSALPGQTMEAHQRNLDTILGLTPPVEHISAYSLIIEEETPFGEEAKKGMLAVVEEDTEREMYWETYRKLEAFGYRQYEISNYAKPGYECRHNCGYWRRAEYLGFGIGAASLIRNIRFSNTKDMEEYIKAPLTSVKKKQELSKEEQMEEFFFLGLRMREGIKCGDFGQYFKCEAREIYGKVIEKNIKDGLLEQKEEEGEVYIRLTDRGIDLSNYCMAQFLI